MVFWVRICILDSKISLTDFQFITPNRTPLKPIHYSVTRMRNPLRLYFRQFGWARFIYFFFKRNVVEKISLNQRFHGEVQSFTASRTEFSETRLNLVIHSISKEDLFGGVTTSLHLFACMRPYFKHARIILTDRTPKGEDLESYGEWTLDTSNGILTGNTIVSCEFRNGKPICIGPRDVFLSTSWWGSLTCIEVLKWQAAEYGEIAPKQFVYFIQDFEAGFYPWSSHYVLAEQSYRHPEQTIAAFNSHQLQTFMHTRGYRFRCEHVYAPKLHPKLADQWCTRFPAGTHHPRKKKVLIYGRADVSRNCFTIILDALRLLAGERDCRDWDFVSLGIQHADVEHKHLKLISLGKVSLPEYAAHMSEAYAGVSLMASPHPSYPPLEMAAFGVRVLTNDFDTRSMKQIARNIRSLDYCTPENLKVALTEIMDTYHESPEGLFDEAFVEDYVASTASQPVMPALAQALVADLN